MQSAGLRWAMCLCVFSGEGNGAPSSGSLDADQSDFFGILRDSQGRPTWITRFLFFDVFWTFFARSVCRQWIFMNFPIFHLVFYSRSLQYVLFQNYHFSIFLLFFFLLNRTNEFFCLISLGAASSFFCGPRRRFVRTGSNSRSQPPFFYFAFQIRSADRLLPSNLTRLRNSVKRSPFPPCRWSSLAVYLKGLQGPKEI